MRADGLRRQDGGRLARGFIHAAELVKKRFRSVAERRGFAATQLVMSWHEVVGEEIASISEPINVAFDPRREEVTLTLLSSGAYAEQVRLSAPVILERVNSAYGYKAVERIRVTQSWKGRRAKSQAERRDEEPRPNAHATDWISPESLGGIQDEELKKALTELGNFICAKSELDNKDPQ